MSAGVGAEKEEERWRERLGVGAGKYSRARNWVRAQHLLPKWEERWMSDVRDARDR